MTTYHKLALLGGLVLFAACDPHAPEYTVEAMDRTTLKADLLPNPNLSCAGACGQVVSDRTGYCGCDAACATFNDCCNDKPQQCSSGGACDYNDPDRNYLGKSVSKCAAMMIKCEPGWEYFMDSCGCGCAKKAAPPCDYSDPDRKYFGKSASKCAVIKFTCDPGWDYFADSCGCGCAKKAAPPPCNYSDPKRKYYGKSASKCAAIYFICDPGWDYFMDSCGCGCEDTTP
jgi:hypothetical protein